MDLGDSVEYIARSEACRVRPLRDETELRELDARVGYRVPAFEVVRVAAGRRARPVPGWEGVGHDNADRMPFVCDYLNRRVLPAIGEEAEVAGIWRIELHDSYSYLPGRGGYAECLTFGRHVDALESRVALVPDPYHMSGFGGGWPTDEVPWERKLPTVFFAGTTTGARDPTRNERLRACVWSLSRPDVACMRITNIAQMSTFDAMAAFPSELPAVLHAPFSAKDHHAYRYVANIVGNTACWSRVPMIMSSGSLMLNARHPDATWYSPLLREGRHYVGVDSAVDGGSWVRAHAWCTSHDRECRAMVAEANALASGLFDGGVPSAYWAAFLEESAHRGRP